MLTLIEVSAGKTVVSISYIMYSTVFVANASEYGHAQIGAALEPILLHLRWALVHNPNNLIGGDDR